MKHVEFINYYVKVLLVHMAVGSVGCTTGCCNTVGCKNNMYLLYLGCT
jgi:hypothetical protein